VNREATRLREDVLPCFRETAALPVQQEVDWHFRQVLLEAFLTPLPEDFRFQLSLGVWFL